MIGIIGNEFFGKRIVDALNKKMTAEYLYPSLHDFGFKNKIKNIEIIHFIGSPTVTTHGVVTLFRFKLWNKKIIVHWIGADSWLATHNLMAKFYTKILKHKIDVHICIEKELTKRIKPLGIDAIVHPLPVATHFTLQPLPKEKNVMIYAPDENEYYWKRFNGDMIIKLVKEFPKVNFYIMRNSGKYFDVPNVTCFRWVKDMQEIYKKVIACVRISTHDGQPGTIIESLSMGRQVIYSQEFPFCKTATTYNELKKELKEILENPTLNVEGAEYVNEHYNLNKITEGLVAIYKKLSSSN